MQPVQLPRDERPHLHHAMEWWYFVGSLKPVAEPTHPGFTVGFIVLRAKVLLQGVIGLVLFVDHANGVQPLRQARQLFTRTYAPHGTTGLRFEFPGGVHPDRTWTLDASRDLHYSLRLTENGRLTIDLDLRPGPAFLLGNHGIVDYDQGVELAYYVRPHLPASGRLRPADGPSIDVVGHMWLERQWGDANVYDVSWKYLLIHRSPDEQWIFFHLEHLVGARTRIQYGCRMTSNGLEPLHAADISFDDFGDEAGIPVCTRVQVRSRGIDLIVEPLFGLDQLYAPALVPPFFEGASHVQGRIDGEGVDCWGMTEIANPKERR